MLLLTAYLGASSAGVTRSAARGGPATEIVLAAVAFYIVIAELANETLGRPVFPLFPLNRTRARAAAPNA